MQMTSTLGVSSSEEMITEIAIYKLAVEHQQYISELISPQKQP